MLDITSKHTQLIESIQKACDDLKIKAGFTRDRIQLYGTEKVESFMGTVGSSNARNVIRYHQFQKTGEVPSSEETRILLKKQKEGFDTPYYGSVV